MINPNQNIIKPLGVTNAPDITLNQPKPSAIEMSDSFMTNSMDLSKKGLPKYKGKKDKTPKVGVIDTPPYNKTPIQSELNKLNQKQNGPNKKKLKNHIDFSGFLMRAAVLIGGVLLLSQVSKPIGTAVKRIWHHLHK